MIIILEGVDGSGKTTLANKLHDQTGFTIIHRDKPKTDEDKQRMMDEYMQVISQGKNCIFDRCWYSEMVYGPVMRDTSVISYPQMFELERVLASKGAIIVHCTGPIKTLWKRCLKRGEDYIVDEATYRKIYNGFDQLMNHVPHYIPVFQYNYESL